MYFADLQSFIAKLEKIGAVERVTAPVDPYLETAAIINQCCKRNRNNCALRFENVVGSKIPLVANLFGSPQRIALAMGVTDIDKIAKRLHDDLSLSKKVDSVQALAQLVCNGGIETVEHDNAPCFAIDATQQGLEILPALQSWPGDGGRYLTLGQIFTRHPESEQQNCGMYRVQILDKSTALLRCHPGSGGSAHMAAWHAQGKSMPVAIVLGGPPILTWCAGVSLPDAVSEFEFTSYLTGQPISVVRCHESGLLVPSTAEIVIEGYVQPGEEKEEGPFGNHTGYYAPISPAPVFRVHRISMREGAVYPCTLVGPPPMENMYLAQAAERLLLQLLKYDHPWVVDVHMPLQGIYHRAAMVSVDTAEMSIEGISKALWESQLLRKSRLIALFDQEIDLHQAEKSYWRIINADSWQKSVLIDDNKMVIDARSTAHRDLVSSDHKTLNKVKKRWSELGLK